MSLSSSIFIEKKSAKRSFRFAHLSQTSSTNTNLLDFARDNDIEIPLVLQADHQTSGRGTRGRQWDNAIDSLMFSVVLPLPQKVVKYISVTLTIGQKIVEYLRKKNIPALLKWPNDVIVNDRKLMGILVENVKTRDQRDALVVGIGLNLRTKPQQSLSYAACSISDFLTISWDQQQKKQWIIDWFDLIADAIDEVESQGLIPTVNRWDSLAAYQNELINLLQDGEIVETALLQGIDESGRLLVSTPQGLRTYLSGTISLRKK